MYSEVNLPENQQDAIPKPVGYRILVAIPQPEEKTKGGIHLPDNLLDREKTASIVGCVVAIGDGCYPAEKFERPWCKEGDYVLFRSYSGTRIKVGSQEFRLINDDTVEGVVDDPRLIMRAY